MQAYRTHFNAMGCANEIVVCADDDASASTALQAAATEVVRIEQKFSRYRSDSIISRINAAAGSGTPIAIDEETAQLLDVAAKLYDLSGGLFDPTSGILRRVWNFTLGEIPSASALEAVLALIGWNKLQRSSDGVTLMLPGMEIDFGGFGKEYASDCAAAVLARHGITNGYVNLAGDIAAVGPQADGTPWLIGVQDPRKPGAVVATIPLSRGGLATSGDSEKYFEAEGRRYCHILNPTTGQPVHCWSSVSVLAATALQAGTLTTIAMLKEDHAEEFLRNSKRPYLLVNLAGRTFSNSPTTSTETKTDNGHN
ncbi:MAG: FAD:protein FMN transferase [Hyphomicrobium sp.]